MRYFYRTKENNEILDYASFEEGINVPSFIIDQYIETDREIVQVTNGRLMFADEVDTESEAMAKLAQAKQNKIAELKSKRDAEEVTLIEYNNHLYDYDSKARERINAAITTLEITGATVQWTTADNDDVELSATDLKNIVMAVAYRSNLLHVKYRGLKERVNSCTTIAEVEAVSWEE